MEDRYSSATRHFGLGHRQAQQVEKVRYNIHVLHVHVHVYSVCVSRYLQVHVHVHVHVHGQYNAQCVNECVLS